MECRFGSVLTVGSEGLIVCVGCRWCLLAHCGCDICASIVFILRLIGTGRQSGLHLTRLVETTPKKIKRTSGTLKRNLADALGNEQLWELRMGVWEAAFYVKTIALFIVKDSNHGALKH